MTQINFKGKTFVQNHHLAVKFHQLVPDKNKSLTDKLSLHDNLIVHGDNLKALKALMPTYAGKVKCIYIDPPYNTGNEGWAYNDNVNSPMIKEWLGKVVDKEDLTCHDKWLCMMTPRLKLLRELLNEDGVIFVSIDDEEVHRLRMLMDEIFQETNFICQFVWKSRQNKDNRNVTGVSIDHEYVLCYGNRLKGSERDMSQFSNPDKDPRGLWVSANMVGLLPEEQRPNCHYDLVDPETGINYGKPKLGWRYDKNTMSKMISEKKIIWPSSPTGRPRKKQFVSEFQQEFTGLSSILGDSIYTRNGTVELEKLFGKRVLDFPKPSALIKSLIIQATQKDDVILDSFAGSGTTGHAVLDLNKEDGGNRKFILVEMEDYADTITAERVRRVIESGIPGTFSYFELGEPVELENILSGKSLPSYTDLARYVYYTATGEEFDESKIDETTNRIGQSKEYEVFLFYKPDLDYLKTTALTLDRAEKLQGKSGKKKLVFAPTKYIDQDNLDRFDIVFAQLPFEIYKLAK